MTAVLEVAGQDVARTVVKPLPRILVVDADPSTGRMLRVALEGKQYRVHWCQSGGDALRHAVEVRPDAVILELDLPDVDGRQVLAGLRDWNDVPILVLTGRATIAEKVWSLDAGANDYLLKPFAPEELAARLRVALRLVPLAVGWPVQGAGRLRLDLASRTASINGHCLRLTATEEVLLFILARHMGSLVPRERLARAVWGAFGSDRSHDLQVHIAHLRRKLEKVDGREIIQTDGSAGYRLSLSVLSCEPAVSAS